MDKWEGVEEHKQIRYIRPMEEDGIINQDMEIGFDEKAIFVKLWFARCHSGNGVLFERYFDTREETLEYASRWGYPSVSQDILDKYL